MLPHVLVDTEVTDSGQVDGVSVDQVPGSGDGDGVDQLPADSEGLRCGRHAHQVDREALQDPAGHPVGGFGGSSGFRVR